MEEFPSNSHQKRKAVPPPSDEPKKIDRVVKGEVIQRKKSPGKRFKELFISGDARLAAGHVFSDILLPRSKEAFSDMVSNYVDGILWGESRPYRAKNKSAGNGLLGRIDYQSHTPYNRYSTGTSQKRQDPRIAGPSRQARARHDFGELIIPSRVEAEEVIDRLFDLVSRYEMATVSDLYELLGLPSDHTDQKWGWTDLRGSGVTRITSGYLLELPRPEPL